MIVASQNHLKNKKVKRNFFRNTIKFGIIFFMWIYKLFGLMPWNVHMFSVTKKNNSTRKNTKNLVFLFSRWGSIYSIFLILIHSISVGFAIPSLFKYHKNSPMSTEVRYFRISITSVKNIFINSIWLVYVMRQQMIFNFNKQLIKVDKIFNNCCNCEPFKSTRLYFLYFMNLVCCVYTITLGFLSWPLAAVLNRGFSAILCFWILVQYSFFLELIYRRFKKINEIILKIGNIPQEFDFQIFFINRLPINKLVIPAIVNMRYVHLELRNACYYLINFYAYPVLVCIIYLGALLTFGLYFVCLYYVICRQSEHEIHNALEDCWVIMISCSLFILTTGVHRTMVEIKKISENIHLVLNFCKITGELEYELIQFSDGLLRQKIEFTTFGIITLDGSLMYSMFGVMITYLVILLQFQSH